MILYFIIVLRPEGASSRATSRATSLVPSLPPNNRQLAGEKRPATHSGSGPGSGSGPLGPPAKRSRRSKGKRPAVNDDDEEDEDDDEEEDEAELAIEISRHALQVPIGANDSSLNVLSGGDGQGEDVETLRRELMGRLAALPAKLGDEKWWESWVEMGKKLCDLDE